MGKIHIYKEYKTTGCVMEDGADTRTTEAKFVLVPESQHELYGEDCVSEYENQDYSYRFESKLLLTLEEEDLSEITLKWITLKVKGGEDGLS